MYKGQQLINVRTEILNRLASGESLITICNEKDLPNKTTVLKWVKEDEHFCNQYAQARLEQAQSYADEIVDIVDTAGLTREDIMKANLRQDARRWIASKLLPKVYGNTTNQTNIQIITEAITGMEIKK